MTSLHNQNVPLATSALNPKQRLSYWQRTTRAFLYLNSNRNTRVSSTNKYVVIGSGISGALTTFQLIENGVSGDEIVILEAREAASGASGRNAGHVRPGKEVIISYCQSDCSLRCVSRIQSLRCNSWA